jgi:hypothetical protein
VRELTRIFFTILAFSAPAAAQSPRVGELVEARIVGPTDPLFGRSCSAELGAVLGDTLLLERSENCSAGSHLAHVRYSRIDRGVRLRRAGLGMLIGAVAGGVIGYVSAGCRIEGCDLSDARSMNAGAGGLLFGAIGTLVGVAWPVHERWTELEGDRQIRVGSFDLRPAIRLSLEERSR